MHCMHCMHFLGHSNLQTLIKPITHSCMCLTGGIACTGTNPPFKICSTLDALLTLLSHCCVCLPGGGIRASEVGGGGGAGGSPAAVEARVAAELRASRAELEVARLKQQVRLLIELEAGCISVF